MMTTFTRTGAMPLARTGRPAVPTSVRTHRGQFSSSVLHKGCDVVIKRAPGRASVQPKAMFSGLGKFFKGDPSKKTQERLQPIVDAVNALESNMQKLSDDELKGMTQKLKQRVAAGESLEDVRAEAFAVVREASLRVLGLRPFDVQIMGAAVLHEGSVAEMRTGEGKTLVAVLPAYLNALGGAGVHVVTVNDYLARRDSEWVGQVHKFLGVSVGLIQAGMDSASRRGAYSSDVTYVTNSELGFDYLRDNLAQAASELVLERGFNYCIIDEVDSILIDEARTPLIISGEAEKPSERYIKANKIAGAMAKEVHYTVDEKQRSVLLTEAGYEAAEDILQVQDLYDPREQWASFVLNAVKAKELFKLEVNYIVKGGEIVIVDEFTGRTMPGRRWSEGQHQAIEAKEGVSISNESVTLASVSYQNFFRAYPKLSGMSGTAATEIDEFSNIYGMSVQCVPTNREVAREDANDVVFRNANGKWRAVRTEIERLHKQGRPILVGTTSVETSELVSRVLTEAGIRHEVLNAKPENVERESEIVAQSGRRGAVTIATNMAGRGTDILLGGNAEFMARLKVREYLMPAVVSLVDEEGNPYAKGAASKRGWKVSKDLYPVELTSEVEKQIVDAVAAAAKAWGPKSLTALEAEDRLSVASEKAPTADATIASLRAAFNAVYDAYRPCCSAQKAEVMALGGLHVIGTERHESRRIDNQLRGRTARQGDPGSTRFFLSLEDNIFRIFGGDRIQAMMSAFRVDDLPIESGMLTDALDTAQKKVESYFFDIRKQLWEYDQVLNTQRDRIYSERRKALLASDLAGLMNEYSEQTMNDILEANIDTKLPPAEWPLDGLAKKVGQYCFLLQDLTGEKLEAECGRDFEKIRAYLHEQGKACYVEKARAVDEINPGLMAEAQRFFLLTQIDNLWKEHLQAMQFLRQAVALRGYGQKDPLTEYKLEGYQLFVDMLARVRRNVIYNVYQFTPNRLTPIDDDEAKTATEEASRGKKGKKFAKAKAEAASA